MSIGCVFAQDSKSDDPRMAGFKGKIAMRYEDSVEDWPKRPPEHLNLGSIAVILLASPLAWLF